MTSLSSFHFIINNPGFALTYLNTLISSSLSSCDVFNKTKLIKILFIQMLNINARIFSPVFL